MKNLKYSAYAELCNIAYKDELDVYDKFASLGIKKNDIVVKEVLKHRFVAIKDGIKQYIVFRGTSNEKEVITDLDFLKDETQNGEIHGGFNHISRKIYNELKEHLNQECWLHFTGHSLGASLCEIISNMAFEDNYMVKASIEIGKPRTGDKRYAKYSVGMPFERVRIVVNMDNITKLPITSMGYRHHNKLLYIDRNGKAFHNPSKMLVKWDAILTFLKNRKLSEIATDHFIKEYVRELKRAGI
jgi:hypothetical protein